MYQIRSKLHDTQWRSCNRDTARNVLSHGYFDPERALAHVDEGATVETSMYQVRRTVESLEPQHSNPKPDEDGNIIFA